jgi:hypothetical protein
MHQSASGGGFDRLAAALTPPAVSAYLAGQSDWRLEAAAEGSRETWLFTPGDARESHPHVRLPLAINREGSRGLLAEALRSIAEISGWTPRELLQHITGRAYEANPKHTEPWQRGRRGSICPKDADGAILLAASEADSRHPGKRYATDGNQAYCGQEHMPGRWHGYPVQWKEVPDGILRRWLADNRVTRRTLKEGW